jgi:hypothetical protein
MCELWIDLLPAGVEIALRLGIDRLDVMRSDPELGPGRRIISPVEDRRHRILPSSMAIFSRQPIMRERTLPPHHCRARSGRI